MYSVSKYLVLVITFLLIAVKGYAQNPLENEEAVFANAADAEKIYLQLSGTSFNTSETIWFKAIVTNIIDHTPTSKSGVLHVELINPLENRIIDKSLLKIRGGIAHGFFQLHPSYPEGKYVIRAYTKWNRNFGSEFIYSIPVDVFRLQNPGTKPDPIKDFTFIKDAEANRFSISSLLDVKALDSLHQGDAMLYMNWKGGGDSIVIKSLEERITHSLSKEVPLIQYSLKTSNEVFTKSVVIDDQFGTLQFFPEGGALVNGLQSVVGFKYLDYRGKGKQIRGTIVDEKDNKVAEFESNILGMGKVLLLPEPGKSYYGVLTTQNGNTFKYALPGAKNKGQVLSLIRKEHTKDLRIWNSQQSNDSLFIKFFHRGKNLFIIKTRFRNGQFSYRFKENIFPQGVIGLTVYDKNYKPIAERHFFNYSEAENLSLGLKTERENYLLRDKVELSVTTSFKGNSLPASVSVMAVDSSFYYSTNLERSSIVSYFLLQSDVKGKVERPSYYFGKEDRREALDHLMLTQGWTNYKYQETVKPKQIPAEIGLEVRGRIESGASNTQSNANTSQSLNMLLLGEPVEAYTENTNVSGQFRFMLEDTYGLGRKFVIQPSNPNLQNGGLKIRIDEREVPEIDIKREQLIVPVDSIVEQKMVQKIAEDLKLDPFLLPSTIALNEVVVSDYRLTPERAQMVALHGMPDKVIDGKELMEKQENWTQNLYRWLLFNYPNELKVRRVGGGAGFEIAYVHNADFTYVVIDGTPVRLEDYSIIGTIPVRAVKSAEIIRNTVSANKYFFDVFDCAPVCSLPPLPAILAIYTHSGQGLSGVFPRGKKTTLTSDTAPQFSPVREYYQPPYQDPEAIDWNIPDRRSLLFWTADLVTDSEGSLTTSFFNSDLSGKMVIICEGYSANGKVGYAELFYKVEVP